MNRLWLELRLTSGCLDQLSGLGEIKINELSAIVADCVVMTINLPVVTTSAVTKLNLMYQSSFLQKAKGVVNRGITNRRQPKTGRLKNLVRGGMIVPSANDLKHRLPLRRQFLLSYHFFCRLPH